MSRTTISNTSTTKPWLRDFLLLAAIWGSSFLFMRLGALEFGAVATAGLRVLIGALTLLPLLMLKAQLPALRRHWRATFLVGVLNSAIPFACFSYAILHITTGLSGILNASVPLFGALVAWAWLKDRPNGLRMLGLGIGFLGIVLLAWDKLGFGAANGAATTSSMANGLAGATAASNGWMDSSGWAVLACLLACLCYGLAASYTKRFLSGIPPLVTAAGSQCGASLVLVLPTLLLWPAQSPGHLAWIAVGVLGVLCTGLAYILYFRLIERAGPARALTVTFLIPVFAVAYGVLFLGESITLRMLLCGLVIVCGTALASGLAQPWVARLAGQWRLRG